MERKWYFKLKQKQNFSIEITPKYPNTLVTVNKGPQVMHSQMWKKEKWKWSRSVVSNSLRPHGLYSIKLFHPRGFRGKNTGVVCHFLLQGIFTTQGSNPGLPHCRQTLYPLSHREAKCELTMIRGKYIVKPRGFVSLPHYSLLILEPYGKEDIDFFLLTLLIEILSRAFIFKMIVLCLFVLMQGAASL